MARGPRYKVPFRRRREGKTDYRCRAKLLRARIPRAVVRQSLKHIAVQFIEYSPEGDRVLASAHSKDLEKKGWRGFKGNTPTAYLTGYLAGKRALSKGIETAVLDIGLRPPTKGSSRFAVLKGMVDAGLEIPHGEELLPTEERLMGAHIDEGIKVKVQEMRDKLEGDL